MKKVVFILLAVLLSSNASALVYTVDDNLAGYTYIGKDKSITGQFNITPFVSSPNFSYSISSAYINFQFLDLQNNVLQSSVSDPNGPGSSIYYHDGHNDYYGYYDPSAAGYYRFISSNGGDWTLSRNLYNSYYDYAAKESISVEGQTNVVTNTNYSTYSGTSKTRSYSYWSSWGDWGYDAWDTYKTNNYSGYSGSFISTMELGTSAVDSLLNDGFLNFDVLGAGDNSYLAWATLTFDYTSTPIPVPTPEPSTIILLGAGLAGMALARRKSRKK